ncbi:hypothetical protein, partial [Arthrobacter sp. DR-2P]
GPCPRRRAAPRRRVPGQRQQSPVPVQYPTTTSTGPDAGM